MNIQTRWVLGNLLFITTCFSLSANAALIGRLPVTLDGTDYQAFYDDVAQLTWLADANAAVGSAYDTFDPGTGQVNWFDASTWAANLNINGVIGWRLPDTVQTDNTCGYQPVNGGYRVSLGTNCTGSELGNLFYNVLGGIAYSSIESTNNTNYDLFANIQPGIYLSSTEYQPLTDYVWHLSFGNGIQNATPKIGNNYAWAVYSGDVSAIPIPAVMWLFGSGLLGLTAMIRRKNRA